MDLETILDDIADYNDKVFENTLNVIDDNLEFIEENELYEPKANYIFIHNYLNHTINHFTNLDQNFIHGTLKKLHRDVENIMKLYTIVNTSLSDITKYKNAYLNTVKILKELRSLSTQGPKQKIHYEQLSILFDSCYEDNFYEQRSYIIDSLKTILNTKMYYLDRMLWIYALKSENIRYFLKKNVKNIEDGIDSKKYIRYRQKVDLPYTEEYLYMKQCLRIFK